MGKLTRAPVVGVEDNLCLGVRAHLEASRWTILVAACWKSFASVGLPESGELSESLGRLTVAVNVDDKDKTQKGEASSSYISYLCALSEAPSGIDWSMPGRNEGAPSCIIDGDIMPAVLD